MKDLFSLYNIFEIEKELLTRARLLNPDGHHRSWGDSLHGGNLTWVGLDPRTLITPLEELEDVISRLNPKLDEVLVDLGAGYGQMALVLKEAAPEVYFKGYEIVPERVYEGQRVLKFMGCERAELFIQNLTEADFKLTNADYYFVYDYGKVPHMRHTMKQIENQLGSRPFKIVARGQGIRSLIDYEFPWAIKTFEDERFAIYSS